MKAAGILLVSGGLVLLLQRPDGSWCMPGGKVEEGERLEFAAVRETQEETGYSVTNVLIPLGTANNPDGFEFTCYAAEVAPFIPVLSVEHTAFVWAHPSKLPEPLFMATGQFISAFNPAAMDAADPTSARRLDYNGWYEIKNNPLSKVGVYPYLGKNIPGADPSRTFMVYRPAEELGSEATIESVKLTPWIDNHVMLGNRPDATPAEQKGVGGVVGQEVYFEGDTLYGNIKLFSAAQGAAIDSGKSELSLGYRCKYEYAPGVYNGQEYEYVQRFIRGNHVASVDDGRMGPEVAVLDHFCFTFDAKDAQTMADEKSPAAGGEGGGEISVADAVKQLTDLMPLLQKLMAIANPGAAPVETVEEVKTEDKPAPVGDEEETDEQKKAKAAAAGAVAAATDEDDDKKPTAAAMDAMDKTLKGMPVAVMKAIAQRDKLANELTPFIGVFDHSEMTRSDVAAYGLKKLGLTEKAKGMDSHTFLTAYLAAKPAPGAGRTAHAMDARDTASGEVPAFVSNWTKGA